MSDPMEALFDEPYHEFARHRQGTLNRNGSVGFMAQQGLEDGMTLEEVAEEIGRSPAQIARALKSAGLECPDWDREDAFRRGLFGPLFRATDKQAAEICGVSDGAMRSWRRRQGIPRNSSRGRA